MPKIPIAVASTSSEDSDVPCSGTAGVFQRTNWDIMHMDSLDSIPFSEVSHSPYGMDSHFLDSVSPGSVPAQRPLLGTAGVSDRGEALETSFKPGVLSPRNGFPRGARLRSRRPSLSCAEVSRAAMSSLPTVPTSFTPKFSEACASCSPSKGVGGDTMPVSAVVLTPRDKRNRRPLPHRTLLQGVEAVRGREGDCANEVLALREVSKRKQPSSVVDPVGREVLSLGSPESQEPLTPPGEDIAPRWSLATALPSVVTGTTTLPTLISTVRRGSTFSQSMSCAATKEDVALSAGTTKGSLHAVDVPVPTSDCSPLLDDESATASSPLISASRVNVASRRRIIPIGMKGRLDSTERGDSGKPVAVHRRSNTGLHDSQDAATETVISTSAHPPAFSFTQKQAYTTARTPESAPPPASLSSSLPASPPALTENHTDQEKCGQARNAQRSVRFSKAPTVGEQAAHEVERKASRQARLLQRALSPSALAVPSTKVEILSPNQQQPPSTSSPAQRTRIRGSALPSTISTKQTQQANDAATPVVAATKEKNSTEVSPQTTISHSPAKPPASTRLHISLSKSTSALMEAGVSPEKRPETRQYGVTDTGSTPTVSRVATEKLVMFVRTVSDPEVLHVIYDYLQEHQKRFPRFRVATAACRELLEHKEEIWRDCLSTMREGGPLRSTQRRVGFASRPRGGSRPQIVDTPDAEVLPAAVQGDTTETPSFSQQLDKAGGLANGTADSDTDEFDDFNCVSTPYVPFARFRYGHPSISGIVTPVFPEGLLYKIKTTKGAYHFFNDTLQEVMVVRVQCRLQGREQINERAIRAPIDDTGSTEITIAVLPEETNFFMSGVAFKPRFLAKRVPVPRDYVSPSLTQSLRRINAEINAVRKALGKWSRASDQKAFLKCCLKNRLSFTDLSFRPDVGSLYRAPLDAFAISAVTWRRPQEYISLDELTQIRLFRGEISCFQVRQGELCNHTVVAAMAAVAQFPVHVRWMFRHPISAPTGKMERAQGCYRVRLLHNGWWHHYLIDDYVPASLKGPLFASCAEDPRRLWVQLLEKAYAKSLGSYAAMCLVDAMEALEDFTGFPVRFIDSLWAAAAQKPDGNASRSLFRYLDRSVRAGCTVLLFSPPTTDEESSPTINMSRKRSSQMLPTTGTVPQFLPGRIYFLGDVAFYEELDLRMVRLKNPWTWETLNNRHYEKKWKYTTWYDHPDSSLSAVGFVAASANLEGPPRSLESRAISPDPRVDVSPEVLALNERKGTMWVRWSEALAAFAGGGVCYTMWDKHRYRIKDAFREGRPRLVLELKARRRAELYVTLSLETVSETLDNFGTIVASRPIPLRGTALSVVRLQENQSAKVISESCDDIESVTGRRTYVVARDVSMKVVVPPSTKSSDAPVFVVPLLDPSGMGGIGVEEGNLPVSNAASMPTAREVCFVLSIVSDAAVGDDKDLSVHFVSLRRSCGVFTDPTREFLLERVSHVTAEYQVCTEAGVITCEGSRIFGNETRTV